MEKIPHHDVNRDEDDCEHNHPHPDVLSEIVDAI
jgi:hypothetical protein